MKIVISIGLCLSLFNHTAQASLKDTVQQGMNRFPQISECLHKESAGRSVWRNTNQISSDRIFIENDMIHIDLSVQLRYQHYFSPDELALAMELIEETRSHIEQFYATQGLRLHLTFYHAPYDSTSLAGHPQPPERSHVVYIRRNTGEHMKSLYWGVNFSWSNTERAAIYTHEVSHLLGLKDEYRTALAERIGEEDNIMNNWDAEYARFYPHQIDTLIAPLCNPKSLPH